MSRLMIALLMSAGRAVARNTAALTSPPMSKDMHDTAIKNTESQYKADKAMCPTLSGNTKDICME